MIQLRIVAPAENARRALDLLQGQECVANLSFLPGASVKPAGDVITCDVLDQDASMVLEQLKELGVGSVGTIDLERLDASIGAATRGAARSERGSAADAVIWEKVKESIASEGAVSAGLIALFALSGVIAAVSILIDSAPIVVGAMALCPDFAAYAAFALGAVRIQRGDMGRGLWALVAGFGVAAVMSLAVVELLRVVDIAPDQFVREGNILAESIAAPNGYSLVVALCAGAAGMLSVTLGRSTALVGVAVSITTIPAAADVGLSTAYGDWVAVRGSALQLAINVAGLLFATTLTLVIQRRIFARQLRKRAAGIDARTAGKSG